MFNSLTFILVVFLPSFLYCLVFLFHAKLQILAETRCTLLKTHTTFVGNLKDCVFQKVHIGERLQQIYEQHSDKTFVGIFSFDKPSLLIRDPELVKNILVKDA
jgi:cytochrome P450 family 6